MIFKALVLSMVAVGLLGRSGLRSFCANAENPSRNLSENSC